MVDFSYEISRIFGISESLFQWPQILTNLILPFILFVYALKSILDKLRIFRSEVVNWGLSIIISSSSLILISVIGPIVAPLSIFIIGILKIGHAKGFILGVIGAVLYWMVLPMIINWISSF